MSKITGLILRILCLSATPWIVFISTTNILFLGNQADVDYDIQVYNSYQKGAQVLGPYCGFTTCQASFSWSFPIRGNFR